MELKLWGGRFTKQTDKLVHNFNASISFDQKFYKQDIDGSIAHVTMLARQQILTDEERDRISTALWKLCSLNAPVRLEKNFIPDGAVTIRLLSI